MRFESEADPRVQVGFSGQVDAVAQLVMANYLDYAVEPGTREEASEVKHITRGRRQTFCR